MSTTNYRQPSDLKEFHHISRSEEERRNAACASAEQVVRIIVNSSLQ